MQRLKASLTVLLFMLCLAPGWARPDSLPTVVGQDKLHTVGDSETMPGIAHASRLAMEHIAFANALPIDKYVPDIDAGTVVVLPLRRILPSDPPRDGLVLNLPERGAYLFRHGHFVNFYPIAIGRPHFETPRGTFYIVEKVTNPSWTPPAWAKLHETFFPPGPRNPLGDRWIGLSSHGLGIHGTTSPDAIGMNISHGCIRMYPDLVRELYEQVAVGMPVRIDYEPVKVGYDTDSGALCMVVYPDVYSLLDPLRRAQSMLAGRGIPARRVSAIVTRHSGRVVSLMSDPVTVEIDGRPVALVHPPVRRGGSLWVPVTVLEAAGARVTTTDDGVTLQQADRTFQLHGHEIVVPAAATLHALGIRYQWDAASSLLSIHRTQQ